jgi:hypothetical protein
MAREFPELSRYRVDCDKYSANFEQIDWTKKGKFDDTESPEVLPCTIEQPLTDSEERPEQAY